MNKKNITKEDIEMVIKNAAKELYGKKGELSQDKFAIEFAKFIGASH